MHKNAAGGQTDRQQAVVKHNLIYLWNIMNIVKNVTNSIRAREQTDSKHFGHAVRLSAKKYAIKMYICINLNICIQVMDSCMRACAGVS